MPPTSIDGVDISGATIDGTEVTEITADGDVVFSGAPDIESTSVWSDSRNGNIYSYDGNINKLDTNSNLGYNGTQIDFVDNDTFVLAECAGRGTALYTLDSNNNITQQSTTTDVRGIMATAPDSKIYKAGNGQLYIYDDTLTLLNSGSVTNMGDETNTYTPSQHGCWGGDGFMYAPLDTTLYKIDVTNFSVSAQTTTGGDKGQNVIYVQDNIYHLKGTQGRVDKYDTSLSQVDSISLTSTGGDDEGGQTIIYVESEDAFYAEYAGNGLYKFDRNMNQLASTNNYDQSINNQGEQALFHEGGRVFLQQADFGTVEFDLNLNRQTSYADGSYASQITTPEWAIYGNDTTPV